ncbi:DUF5610 domain-containing protein [Pseudoalteromonas luteoviolacea]|uniref:DUF5610 domain-containing protein n=1 Tax=Pseudoalteromonas luteoviolacea NCIMB 1942 TaxID=1365253 RepID=A0A166ZXH8_9GAMM|nr:DUF5610 domain-containing protein [Pseudoalteromonas luteoviolacea]KZN44768.1 hypothetical protein N482_15445 [Pseudoalteromonas luteoviolacea NCIMB 1942]
MKIGQLNQLLNPAMQHKGAQAKSPIPNISINSDQYQGNKSQVAAKILDDKLAEALGIEKKEEPKKPLFDFEEIVKNVLGFVQGAINKAKADGKDDDTLKSMLEQAREGVQTGIDEATDELSESGLFNEEIKDGIEKSREGIFKGLDDFEKELFDPSPQHVSLSAAQFASLSNKAEYAFTTAEGDEVVISFNDAFSKSRAASYYQDGDNQGFAYGESQKREVNFSISVNGELNEEEQEAINAMMEDIRDVSDSFFAGEYDEAFELAQGLSLNSEQITNFTMDLRQSKTSAAIAQYQQSNPMKELEQAFAPLDKRLEGINEEGRALGIESQLPDIMAWMNEGQQRLNQLLDYAQSYFSALNGKSESQNDHIS